ncbi:MAG: hypothetical protein M0D55_17450 [Elusimicrobiota bacterium]|nr:MAG: hypothetical protein M0D55_17450 [Elusimicrobiota bacterium]
MTAPAPSLPPVALEAAFVSALAAAKPAEDPLSVLARAASPAEKLAAIDALHRSLPNIPQAKRTKVLDALRAAAESAAEAPAVRAKALTTLGYSVPVVGDTAAREAAVRTLLAAANGSYRVHALRGLAPATHDLPEAVEADVQGVLLSLLAGTPTEEERLTALLALDGFVRAREDLPRRRPDLVASLEAALLAPIAADPAAYCARGTANVRLLELAVVWHSARNRHSAGEPAALEHVNALLRRLAALETDPAVKAEIASFLAAPAPKLL